MCRDDVVNNTEEMALVLPDDIHFFRNAGESVTGRFLRYEVDPRPGRGDIKIAVLEMDDNKLCALYLVAKSLAGKFEHLAPVPGDRVTVVFKGDRRSFAGNVYADFHVTKMASDASGSSAGPTGASATVEMHLNQQ